MNVEVIMVKEIPTQQISNFEDRVVYNVAVLTREYTKSNNSYPYLSGELQRNEISAPIIGSNKTYGLDSGVDYAKYVYKMNKANWTNSATVPHWYMTNFNTQGKTITSNAVSTALKEV